MSERKAEGKTLPPLFFCPLTGGECKRERCMWYMRARKKCAVMVIAEKL